MPKEPRSNYAINPTPEQALRSNRSIQPARVIAALGISMSSFVVVLDPKRLNNADTDLSVIVPDAIERISEGFALSEGWTYADNETMQLYFSCSDSAKGLELIRKTLSLGTFKENDLSQALVGFRPLNTGKLNNHQLKLVGLCCGLKVRIRVA